MELFFLFHLFSCTNKQFSTGFSVYCYHDMPLICNLLSQTMMPQPGNCLIFLPKLFAHQGDWSLVQQPRGVWDLHPWRSPQAVWMWSWRACSRLCCWSRGGQYDLQGPFQPQPLRFGHLVILWLSTEEFPLSAISCILYPCICNLQKFPYTSPFLTGLHMQPPDITLRHQEVSKNKQKEMENVKGYKGMSKMVENSFCKAIQWHQTAPLF